MRAARAFGVLLAGLLLGAGTELPGATLYVNRIVVAPAGDVSLGALVRTTGPLSPQGQETLARSATVLRDRVQYVPASSYASQLEAAFGVDAIVVGAWSIVIPAGTSAEAEPYLLDRLTDFLLAQNLLGDGAVDFSFTLGTLSGAPPQDGTPSFQLMKGSHGTDVSFKLTGSSGSSVSGRVTLPPGPAVAEGQTGVRSNAAVRVVFRKGPITVEMPGRALSTAAVGDTVNVAVPDTQKTFTGRLMDGKAVQVDLP